MDVGTLDDITVQGRRLGVRVDLNSPLDDGEIADDARLRAHAETLEELVERGGRLAVLAHQGRPCGDEFAPLAAHAERLDDLLDAPVGYEDATFGRCARERVRSLDDGEVVVLENVRFYSEEYETWEPAAAAGTVLVEKLAPELDAFVNDAFAAAHRSQPSIVGFPQVLPAVAGRVMEREVEVLGAVEETPRPRTFVLGGAKVPDSMDVAASVLANGLADRVLTTGVVANCFLLAAGVDLGTGTRSFVEEQGYGDQVERAGDLLDAHGDSVVTPPDVAVEVDGERVERSVGDAFGDEAALDVGSETVAQYRETIVGDGTVVLNGPAGVVERPAFRAGTRGIFEAATEAGYSIVGGGDTSAALRDLGIEGFDHVSTGGGACLRMLTGDPLPGLEALRRAGP